MTASFRMRLTGCATAMPQPLTNGVRSVLPTDILSPTPIEKLYKDYHEKGLEILDIPCNQFGGQAPGSDDEIHEFCSIHYNTTFEQMKKSNVNGANELPLYTYLKSQKGFEGFDEHQYKPLLEKMFSEADPDWAKKPDIKWNFTKFIVDRSGNVVARFEPTADISKVEECIKSLL